MLLELSKHFDEVFGAFCKESASTMPVAELQIGNILKTSFPA